jgi:hypothetical protein
LEIKNIFLNLMEDYMKSKNLAKLALMGLLVASSQTTISASETSTGTLLAAGCKSNGGCSTIAMDNTPVYPQNGQRSSCAGNGSANGTQKSSCSGSATPNGMQKSSCGGNGSCGQKPQSNQQMTQNRNMNDNSYNTNRNYQSSQPEYYNNTNSTTPTPKNYTAYNDTTPMPLKTPQPSSTPSNYYYNTANNTGSPSRTPAVPVNYYYNTADNSHQMTNMNATTTKRMSEADLLNKLNADSKKIYWSLDQQGRAIALSLASDESYDANMAVNEAAKQMKMMNSSSGKY